MCLVEALSIAACLLVRPFVRSFSSIEATKVSAEKPTERQAKQISASQVNVRQTSGSLSKVKLYQVYIWEMQRSSKITVASSRLRVTQRSRRLIDNAKTSRCEDLPER